MTGSSTSRLAGDSCFEERKAAFLADPRRSGAVSPLARAGVGAGVLHSALRRHPLPDLLERDLESKRLPARGRGRGRGVARPLPGAPPGEPERGLHRATAAAQGARLPGLPSALPYQGFAFRKPTLYPSELRGRAGNVVNPRGIPRRVEGRRRPTGR
jgi:hypothetical protein